MNVLTYRALDRVDYDNLVIEASEGRQKLDGVVGGEVPEKTPSRPSAESLVDIVAKTIVWNETLLCEALETVPYHLVHSLLRASIKAQQYGAASILISEWPMETLKLQDVYPEGKENLFRQIVEFDTAVFMGLMRREEVPHKVKLKCLDLRGFQINEIFSRVLIGALPLLSIQREERDVEVFVRKLMQFLSIEGHGDGDENEYDSLEDDLRPIIKDKIEQFKSGYVFVPPGGELVVKMDRLEFGRESVKYMEYLVMGALRSLTPCRLEAYNLYVQTNIKENERLIDSCAPFLALLGQDPQILFGLSLNNMEDMLFQFILRGVARFTKLRALDIGDCSISVIGKTRVRTALRNRIVYLFSTFTQLCRLDLHKSELTGNLAELLDALPHTLEYLNLSSCSLREEDLQYLSNCKHTASLKELHLSSLVRRGELESPEPILKCIEAFTNQLSVLEVQNNEISDEHIGNLCGIISRFKTLKLLDASYNFLGQEALLKLVEAAARCRSMQCTAINLLPIFGSDQDVLDRRAVFQTKCEEVLQRCGRRDLSLVVIAIGIE